MTDVMKTFLCAEHAPAAIREVQGAYYISWDYRDVRNNTCEKCGEWANAVVVQGELMKTVIQRFPKKLCEEQKAWLQGLAEKLAGRPVPVSIVVADAGTEAALPPAPVAAAPKPASAGAADDALADPTVQAVLEIFPVEKTTVEEI